MRKNQRNSRWKGHNLSTPNNIYIGYTNMQMIPSASSLSSSSGNHSRTTTSTHSRKTHSLIDNMWMSLKRQSTTDTPVENSHSIPIEFNSQQENVKLKMENDNLKLENDTLQQNLFN
eukprot:790994_1